MLKTLVQLPPARFALLIFLLAFSVRAVGVLSLRDPTKFHGLQAGADAVEFHDYALSLARGEGFVRPDHKPTSFRAPGWPLALSMVYFFFYDNYPLTYLFQVLLSALACMVVYPLARETLNNEAAARLAGLLGVFYFAHIYFATIFTSETLFTLMLGWGMLLLLKGWKSGSLAMAAGAGVAVGCAVLVRPFAVTLIPLFLPLFWLQRRQWPRWLPAALCFGAASVLTLVPWAYRNYLVHGQVVLFTTNGGSTFYGANNDIVLKERSHLGSWVATNELPGRDRIDQTPDEVSHDRLEFQLGMQWVKEHWTSMPRLEFYKLVRLILPDIESGNKKFVLLNSVLYLPYLVILAFGMTGWRKDPNAWSPPWMAMHAVIVSTLVLTLVFYGCARFRDAVFPVLMCYAARGCVRLWPGVVDRLSGE